MSGPYIRSYRSIAQPWKDDSRLIHYHLDERKFTDSFGDSVHHNSIWIIGLWKATSLKPDGFKKLTVSTVREFVDAIKRLTNSAGEVSRHVRDLSPCSRDQYIPLIYALTICAKILRHRRTEILVLRDKILVHVWNTFPETWKLPHYRKHFLDSIFWDHKLDISYHYNTIYGDRLVKTLWKDIFIKFAGIFNFFDALADWITQLLIPLNLKFLSGRNGVDSSIVKNIVRAAVLDKHEVRFFNSVKVMKRYFSYAHATDHKPPYIIALPWEEWVNAKRKI